ncbi:MAG: gfo/Idh/MocA family oxidoreductase [Spirochaetaceae bacterium]|nr:MAG: gfo/Idh/MocA family oxidoreductase [Spirochaetaceae bacterium]
MSDSKKLKLGMVGGGRDASIGAVHRCAAWLDGLYDLTAGALSSTPEKAKASGNDLGLANDRNYGSWEEMLEKESSRPEGERIDTVSIVTPNHMHFPVAKAFVEAGFNVICDKPLVHTSAQAEELVSLVEKQGTVFAVTYNYTGYPMVKQARQMIRESALGEIRKVIVEYNQDWLATKLEDQGAKQAEWRTDPKRSGIAGAVGDIGSHAENLVSTMTGLEIAALCADVSTYVKGRLLDDDANLLVRYRSGAKGVMFASQISSGEENDLRIRVYGEKASLTWHQENPNYLRFKQLGQPEQLLKRGNGYLCEAAQRASRIPPGHPEAFIEAFANVYRNAGHSILALKEGRVPDEFESDYPTVADGARGVRFIEKTIESGKSSEKWIKV